MPSRIKFHPDAPRSLVRLYRKLKTTRAVAEYLGVNRRYVWQALARGTQPSNPRIADALGFPARRLAMGDRRTKHMRWWLQRLTGQQRNKLIFDWFHYREDERKDR